jgi:hypothetical protein
MCPRKIGKRDRKTLPILAQRGIHKIDAAFAEKAAFAVGAQQIDIIGGHAERVGGFGGGLQFLQGFHCEPGADARAAIQVQACQVIGTHL